ncbi:hypothetical protein evm_000596 [Chilo suppressalis]|nr:hypothetical protein evm_000596 [Chilo suppressalis]
MQQFLIKYLGFQELGRQPRWRGGLYAGFHGVADSRGPVYLPPPGLEPNPKRTKEIIGLSVLNLLHSNEHYCIRHEDQATAHNVGQNFFIPEACAFLGLTDRNDTTGAIYAVLSKLHHKTLL